MLSGKAFCELLKGIKSRRKGISASIHKDQGRCTGVVNWFAEHDAENIVQTMKATKPWIEETREFFGLLILIVVFGINYVYYKVLFYKGLRRE